MESRKNGTDEPICRAGIEMHMSRMDLRTQREGKDGMNWESSVDIYALPWVKQAAGGKLVYSRGSSACAL